MDPPHPLRAILQLHLTSDSHAVLHLSYILSSLTSACFSPSPHTQKWTTRVNSLLHSKDPGARWAGLCIAHKTSVLSKSIMIEFAQSWLGVALPMLSRNEPAPTLKASLRLLIQIFSAATDVPEFQRQVSTPNVPKFTVALISLAEKHEDREVKLLSLFILTRLIPFYPTLHRVQHTALQSLCLKFLNGSTPTPTDKNLLEAASQLYTLVHFTGGKVGAANLWRKSLDETLVFSRNAFTNLRTTFPDESRNVNQPGPSAEDPVMWVPLNIDRLRCGVVILCDLLRSTTHRPVQLPIGPLVRFTMELLSSTAEEQTDGHVDASVRAMEVSALSAIWEYGCDLLTCLAKSARHHLTPAQTRVISYIIYHLEQPINPSDRLSFLRATQAVLTHCHLLHSPLIPTRLAKAILSPLTVVLATQSEAQGTEDSGAAVNGNKNKKGKKRARGYEGDEVFKVSRGVICATEADGEVLIAALEATKIVLRNPHVTPAVHSIVSRVLLSMLLALPRMTPASLSTDPLLHGRVLSTVHELCVTLSLGTTSAMSKSLGLVIRSGGISDGSEHALLSGGEIHRSLDLLLHPRVPPLVRSLPHVESLSLFRAEENHEEVDAREALGLEVADQYPMVAPSLDVPMTYVIPAVTATPPLRSLTAPTPSTTVTFANDAAAPVSVATPQIKMAQPISLATLPPLPAPSAAAIKVSTTIHVPVQAVTVAIAMEEDEEDEEIPTIDMDSDSD